MAHLGFDVAGERYALHTASVLEVTRSVPPTPVPGAPAAVLGLLSLRGRILPLLDLAALLGKEPAAPGRWAVIAERRPLVAGLSVDLVRGVEELPSERRPSESPLLANVVVVDGGPVGIIDLDGLLGAEALALRPA